MPRLRLATVLLCVLAGVVSVAALPQPAEAQVQRAQRPYRGLFGGSEADPTSRQSLDFSAGLNFGYDDNVSGQPGVGTGFDPRLQAGSRYLGGGASLSYDRQGDRVSFSANGTTSARLYTELNDLVGLSHSGGVGLSARLSSRTTVAVNGQLGYSPFYTMGLLPPLFLPELGDPPVFREDLVVYEVESLYYGANMGLSHTLGRRTTLNASYSYNGTDYLDEQQDLKYQSAYAGLTQAITQHASLRLGYGYGRGDYVGTGDLSNISETHNVDVGIDYGRALSFSRKTTFSFSTGSAIVRTQDDTQARLTGNVNLNYQIGQSWSASGFYNRGVGFQSGFNEPTFADTVGVGLTGYAGWRTQLSFSSGYSSGGLFTTSDGGYDTWYSSATVQVAVTRFMAVVGNYGYYRYAYENAEMVPFGLPPELDRQAIRVGLTFWVPLLR